MNAELKIEKQMARVRFLEIILAVVLAALRAHAGLFDKAWLKGTTEKNPVSYATGEPIRFTVTPMALDGVVPEGAYELRWKRSDDFGAIEKGVEPFAGEPFVFETRLDRPGFVRLEVGVHDAASGERQLLFDGGAGVSPEALKPPVEPNDFDEFWARQFARLDLVPVKADLVKTDCPNSDCRRWAVRVDCAGLRPVTGYLSIPKATGEGAKFPCRLTTQGYNGDQFLPNKPGDTRPDEIVFDINAHGLKLPEFGATEADRKALRWEARSHDKKYAYDPAQNADPETAYFNGMVLRVKRALQFLKTIEGWNGRDLYVEGGSQGGLQTIWAAGCGEGVTGAFPYIVWCCNLPANERRLTLKAATDGGCIPWVPALGYYDAVTWASRIPFGCRVEITRAGLGDYVSPPQGLAMLWNAIHQGNKKIVWVQGSRHKEVPPQYKGRDTVLVE